MRPTDEVKKLSNKVKNGGQKLPVTKYNLTADKIKKLLPRGSSHQVTENVMAMIHRMEDDTGLEQSHLEEQVLSNINLLKEVKVSMEEYVNAIKYCSLKQNMSNRKAWEIVFPERLARAEAKIEAQKYKTEDKRVEVNIDSHVSNYNKSPLVVKIDTAIIVPWHIQHMHVRTMALKNLTNIANGKCAPNAEGEVMTVTPHVQFLANKELLEVLAPPPEAKLEIDLNVKDTSLEELKMDLADMAKKSMEQLKSGEVSLLDIGSMKPKRSKDDEDIIDV